MLMSAQASGGMASLACCASRWATSAAPSARLPVGCCKPGAWTSAPAQPAWRFLSAGSLLTSRAVVCLAASALQRCCSGRACAEVECGGSSRVRRSHSAAASFAGPCPHPRARCRLVQGSVLRCDVQGRLVMKAFLSGMPDIKLGLNDKLEVRRWRRQRPAPRAAAGGCAPVTRCSRLRQWRLLACSCWRAAERAPPGRISSATAEALWAADPPVIYAHLPPNLCRFGPCPLGRTPPAGRDLPPLRQPGALQR